MVPTPRFLTRKCKWAHIACKKKLTQWYDTIRRIRAWDITEEEQEEILTKLCSEIALSQKERKADYYSDILLLTKKYKEIDVFEDGYGLPLCDPKIDDKTKDEMIEDVCDPQRINYKQ